MVYLYKEMYINEAEICGCARADSLNHLRNSTHKSLPPSEDIFLFVSQELYFNSLLLDFH